MRNGGEKWSNKEKRYKREKQTVVVWLEPKCEREDDEEDVGGGLTEDGG